MTDSGSIIGALPDSTKIIAVAGHDTQCAVAAMPVEEGESAAFLSCGTWSLIGCELETPILTKESCDSGLSNEYGANGRINYLKNIIGLWLIQESRREYARQGEEYSFGELASWRTKQRLFTALLIRMHKNSWHPETFRKEYKSSAVEPVSRCRRQWERQCGAFTKVWQ